MAACQLFKERKGEALGSAGPNSLRSSEVSSFTDNKHECGVKKPGGATGGGSAEVENTEPSAWCHYQLLRKYQRFKVD